MAGRHHRNRWTPCSGISGRNAPESVDGLDRNTHEKSRIEELAWLFPDLKPSLYSIADRLMDLLPIVREHIYHPSFAGSFSLKAVAPVLLGIDYGDLDIGSGGQAALELGRLLITTDVLTTEERAEIRAQLLEYCKQDTRCLVQLLGRLRELSR